MKSFACLRQLCCRFPIVLNVSSKTTDSRTNSSGRSIAAFNTFMNRGRCFSSSSSSPSSSSSSSSSPRPSAAATGTSRGPVTFASLAFTALAGAGLLTYYQLEKEKKVQRVTSEVVTTGKPALGGPWILVDQGGIPRTDASYRGQYLLIYFGFTYCPDICPSELVKVGRIMDELKKLNVTNVKPIFISVDPARDTVGQLKHYSKDFHSSFDFLTGTKDQVAVASKAFRVYFSKANENVNDDEDYLVDHSIVVYFMGPDGTFLEFFTQKAQLGDIVSKIEKHVSKK